MSNQWTRTAINAMYGYNVEGKGDLPYYKIENDIPNFTGDTYAYLVGFLYSVSFIPMIIFVGYITENTNRKNLIAISCFLWGAC